MRTILLLSAPLLLLACGQAESGPAAAPFDTAAGEDRIECAFGEMAQFERFCAVERTSGADGLVLTVRKPSGGFRRLRVTGDGRGVVAADGAEPARVRIIDEGRIEVEIAGERYRLPATVG